MIGVSGKIFSTVTGKGKERGGLVKFCRPPGEDGEIIVPWQTGRRR
jgi:hypothetical protein